MNLNSKVWSSFYAEEVNSKPLTPESFIARIFLSRNPVSLLRSYDFKEKKILDVGCGNGRHSFFFNQLGFDAYGFEVSDKKAMSLNEKFNTDHFFSSVTDNIKAKDESYDYVVGANAIYYLEGKDSSIEKNLAELSRVLKKGGCLIISFVGPKHFLLKHCHILKDKSVVIKKDPLEFRNNTRIRPGWDKADIKAMVENSHGLKVEKIGEILDECDNIYRHLFYCVIYKE